MNIAKKIKWSNGGCGWIVVDDQNISYNHHHGQMPYALDVMLLLLADKDIRWLCQEYMRRGRKYPFKISSREGMSGAQDYFIDILQYFGGSWHSMKKTHLLHVSMHGKLNEPTSMYVGDFVELVNYLQLHYSKKYSDLPRRKIFRMSGAKYVKERNIEFDYYTKLPTNIFE